MPPSKHPAEQYARDVAGGRIVAGQLVRRACDRHLHDLAHGKDRGLWFDANAAQHVLDFFGFLRHSKGEWGGQPIALEPWQQFSLWTLCGWKRADGLRRFRTAYQSVARKNGKSTICSGVGLYLLLADGEPGAEVYACATKREQAKIVFGEAQRMARASAEIGKRLTLLKENMHSVATASKFEPLSSEADTLDGLNVHGALIDELHAHKTRDLYDVIETATGARRQPLVFNITTAGFNQQGILRAAHLRPANPGRFRQAGRDPRRHLFLSRLYDRPGGRLARPRLLAQGQSQLGRQRQARRPGAQGGQGPAARQRPK